MIATMCYSKFCNLRLTFTNICALFVCVCYPCGACIYGSWYVGGSAAGVGAPALSALPPSCLSSLKPLNWAHCGNAAPGGPRTESGTLTHRQSAFEVAMNWESLQEWKYKRACVSTCSVSPWGGPQEISSGVSPTPGWLAGWEWNIWRQELSRPHLLMR